MIDIYKTNIESGRLEQIEKPIKGCWINIVKPTNIELESISKLIDIDSKILKYPLDMAEKAHIDTEDDSVLIVVDSPATEIKNGTKIYTTLPIGMILVRDDIFITISQEKINSIEAIIGNNKENYVHTDKKSRFVFQLLFDIAQDYIRYLTYINKDIEAFENHMEKSMRNKELMRLLHFEKCMIYFNASVKGNQVVLEKLNRGKAIKLYEEDTDILEDTLIENRQAIEMIQTYSDILNGIIDIFGTIISNNLNIVMKFLTSLTLLIALPTLISSVLGMNVAFPFDTSVIGFWSVIAVSVLLTIIGWFWLKKKDLI
ncbi:MAG: magnesium transporter CorA family protein [Clostridia bacterium]|nr:magnesium transporter CorA family protein [Clostridia bacterium]